MMIRRVLAKVKGMLSIEDELEESFSAQGLGLGTEVKEEVVVDTTSSSVAAAGTSTFEVPYGWNRLGMLTPPIHPLKWMFPKIYNIVAVMKLGTTINLEELFEKGHNLSYNPGKGPRCVVMRLKKPCLSANVFQCGMVRITGGVESEVECKVGARRIARMIQKCGFRVTFKCYRVVTIMGQSNVGFPVSAEKMLLGQWNGFAERRVSKTSGKPTQVVAYRFKNERNKAMTLSISEAGYIRLIGVVSEAELEKMFLRAYSIARSCIENKSKA